MSLYHSYDSQYRKLQESWKQVQEDEYQDALRSRGTKLSPAENEYTERPGLEGPFRMHNGKTYYYDPKEGKYYDPTTDWYVDSDSEEFYQLTGMKKMGESLEESDSSSSQAHELALKSIQMMKDAEKAYDSLGSEYTKYQMETSEVIASMQPLEDLLRDKETYSSIYEKFEGFESSENIREQIEEAIDAPFKRVKTSTLGGSPSHAIYVSLDPQETWSNRIYQNSRYITFMLHEDSGSLELLSKGLKIPIKFRKSRVKNIEQTINKINSYIQAIKTHGQEA